MEIKLFCAFKLSLHLCICCKQLKCWIHLFVTVMQMCLSSYSTKCLKNCRWHMQKKMDKPISLLARISNALRAQFCHRDQWFVPSQPPHVWILKRSRRNCRKCRAASCEPGFNVVSLNGRNSYAVIKAGVHNILSIAGPIAFTCNIMN